MKFPTAKTQIIAAAAVLLLLGGFTAALAYDGNGATPFGTPSTSTQQSGSATPTAITSTASTTSTTSTTTTTSTVTVCPLDTSAGNPCCPPNASTATPCCPPNASNASTATLCCPPETSSDFQCIHHPEIFNLLLSPPQIVVTASATSQATINPLPSGHAHISVQGNTLYVTVEVVHLTPLTQYSVNLEIDGTSTQLATLVTNNAGNGYIVAQLLLASGTHSVSVQVIGASGTSTTTIALVSDSVTIVTPAPGPGPVAVTVGANANLGDDK